MKRAPRVAALHDLSAFGRCSLTVVAPVLSAMGVQCCPVPTAYLSTHTGGFSDMVRLDLTGEMEGTIAHWERLGLSFEGIYTGYLASPQQARLCLRAAQRLRGAGGVVVVDPVLGDGGRLYASCGVEMCGAMAEACSAADVITPNLTEAAILLGMEYGAAERIHREELARRLSDAGRRSVVLTGAKRGNEVGAACFDRATGATFSVFAPAVEGEFHGTGDLFASVLTGALVQGDDLAAAAARAARFVSLCAARTLELGTPRREGVDFEPLLGRLAREKGL